MASPVTDQEIATAVRHFWESRLAEDDMEDTPQSQEGRRNEVLDDSHMSDFGAILYEKLLETGLPQSAIGTDTEVTKKSPVLPGYFRPSKEWDLVVVQEGNLIAAVEFKSQASSFGNNWNNRVEEAIGNAFDVRSSMNEGVIESPVRPWLGYFFLMDEQGTSEGTNSSLPKIRRVDTFTDLSYANRCEKLCLRLVEKDLYDGAAFILSEEEGGVDGEFRSPNPELEFQRFTSSLVDHVAGYLDEFGVRQQGLDGF
jgi:hypothetical protein